MNREKIIIQTSAIGIVANIFLAAFKAAVGFFSSSIAIILDSVNNLTDSLSSLITIIGTRLAAKPADKKHPFGHGRAEYLSALIIGGLILYAGLTAFIESCKKIITPATPDYGLSSIVIVTAAIFVKIFLGLFTIRRGKTANSDSLVASGKDALMDSIISASTLIAAIIFMIFKLSIESYVGIVISVAIIKNGFETLRETVSKILGERIESDLSKKIKNTVKTVDSEIMGVYDLVLNNYGPDTHLGSCHIEVPDSWNSSKIDEVSRKISATVLHEHNILMTAIGVYSVNLSNPLYIQLKEKVSGIVMSHREILQMHGFYVDERTKTMRFDLIVSFESADMKSIFAHVVEDVKLAFPDYNVQVQFDSDISD